ncbi:glycoside hydrolase family 61 protein [Rutstroemia sp. NJR-2017a BVV2]|nr:glycoside hydrolase family 61 protein [Rutstroemia sp. NJR-2017a BVV2]
MIALLFAAKALSHSTFQELWVNNVDQAGTCVRTPPSNSPVTSVTSTDIRCNVGGTKGVSGICNVPGSCRLSPVVVVSFANTRLAGSNVTVEMHQQPGDRSCANEAIGGNHYGPVIIYMSKVSNAATDAGAGPWFKVSQEGYNVPNKWWGTQTLNANCGKRSFIVPSDLAPGQYLLRAEVIALHVASSVGGAQCEYDDSFSSKSPRLYRRLCFIRLHQSLIRVIVPLSCRLVLLSTTIDVCVIVYLSCYQLNVTGSGTKNPTGVSFPGAYSATDPGIQINIYGTITSYTIPGPTAVFTG